MAVSPTGAVTLAGRAQSTGSTALPAVPALARFTPTGANDGQATYGNPGGNRQFTDVAQAGAGVIATGSFAGFSQGLLQRIDANLVSAGRSTWPGARGEAVALDSLGGAVVAGRNGNGNIWSLQTGWFTPSGVATRTGRVQPAAHRRRRARRAGDGAR